MSIFCVIFNETLNSEKSISDNLGPLKIIIANYKSAMILYQCLASCKVLLYVQEFSSTYCPTCIA